jgi:hypothetical protein
MKHNKYLPKYLSSKILNAVGFIEYTKEKGELDMKGITKFLMKKRSLLKKKWDGYCYYYLLKLLKRY